MAFAITLFAGGLAYAAEVKVMSSSGYRGAIRELARNFEGTTGHKVVVRIPLKMTGVSDGS